MPAEWTGEIVKKMHLANITRQDVASKLGVTPEYVSMVLKGSRNPAGAQDKFETALEELLGNKNEENTHG